MKVIFDKEFDKFLGESSKIKKILPLHVFRMGNFLFCETRL